MKLLILGGTRFFGKLVLLRCIEEGHQVTYVSRHRLPEKKNLNCIQGERDQVISMLDGNHFDVVIDFSGYDSEKVEAILRHVSTPHYIFISSLWASQFVEKSRLFTVEEEAYVQEKIAAEKALKNWAHDGEKATILRFPIVLGPNDHSGRLDYLARRIVKNRPITLYESDPNELAITFVEDAANLLMRIISSKILNRSFQVLNCSTGGMRYNIFLNLIGKALDVSTKIIFANHDELLRYFPKFFQVDPFWRERPYKISDRNAFLEFSVPVTPYEEWLRVSLRNYDPKTSNLLKSDRKYAWMQAAFLKQEKKWVDVCCG